MTLRVFSPDPVHYDFDENGVPGFLLPLGQAERAAFRDRLWLSLSTLCRSNEGNGFLLLSVIMNTVLADVLALFMGVALQRRLAQENVKLVGGDRTQLWAALSEGRTPPTPVNLDRMQRGFSQEAGLRRGLRHMRGWFTPRFPAVSAHSQVDFRRDIVSVTKDAIILQHAAGVDERIRLVSNLHWYRSLQATDRAAFATAEHDAVCESFISEVSAAFTAHGENLNEANAVYLRRIVSGYLELADRYLSRMLKAPAGIPRRLWMTGGSSFLARTLRLASRLNGGYVVAHDHGQGQAMAKGYHHVATELPLADRFITYTALQARISRQQMRVDMLPHVASPRIESLPVEGRKKLLVEKFDRKAAQMTVMLMGTVFHDEHGNFTPMPPAISLVDWESRMIANLRQQGYRVIYKPHPESPYGFPERYATVLGAEIERARFEDCQHRADVIIFGFCWSTTLTLALQLKKPIVIADMGYCHWSNAALQHAQSRCAFLPAKLDEENRSMTDWRALPEAIERALILVNSDFVDDFFGLEV